MIDIDHFKSVNDAYGHPVGDQVIRGITWLLKGRLRSSDIIGRYGGEEFLVALPDVTPEQARIVIDRIREDFSSLPHAHAGGALFCTFSAGIASYPDFDLSANADRSSRQRPARIETARAQPRHHGSSISRPIGRLPGYPSNTQAHTKATLSKAIKPLRYRRPWLALKSGWRSREIRSTTASMAELTSSTTNTSNTQAIIKPRPTPLTGKKKAAGISIA